VKTNIFSVKKNHASNYAELLATALGTGGTVQVGIARESWGD
jgi:hypothetical protein